MPRYLANPYLMLVLTVLFWASNMVVGRAVRADVPPFTLVFWRWVVAALFVFPLALPHLRQQWPLLRRGWRVLLVFGLLGVAGFNSFAYLGLQHTTATNAALLNSVIPIVTIVISCAFLGKRLQALEWLGTLVSFAGVLVIVGRGSVSALAKLHFNVGDAWLLLAVVDWAIYTVALAWRPAGLHPMLLLAAMVAMGLCTLAPAVAWEMLHGQVVVVSSMSLTAIVYLGVFPSFVSYVLYNRSVAEVGANRASLFIHLMPVFGTLLAALFLGEVPRLYHYLGIALIFAGIGMTMLRPGR